jgi:hypothetical protein
MKVCVVFRQLNGFDASVLCFIEPPTHSVDNLENYFECVAKEEINRFRTQFKEFTAAKFYSEIKDTI